MKTFLQTFLVCLVLGSLALFFGAALFQGWTLLIVGALILAGVITGFINLTDRVEALEKRVQAPEAPQEEK